jgi:hypothetical protein
VAPCRGSAVPRLLRRAASFLATILVAAVGVFGTLAWLTARDEATFREPTGPGRSFPDLGGRHLAPGEPRGVELNSDPPTSGPHLPIRVLRDGRRLTDDGLLHAIHLGNVVLLHADGPPPPGLRRLALEAGGPFSPTRARAGEAVILAPHPGLEGERVVAVAWRNRLRAGSSSDPALLDFIDAFLGAHRPEQEA